MSQLLSKFLAAGLIENIGGDDALFEKIERASSELAEGFKATPRRLIGAILAGLDPNVSGDDPAIAAAEAALINEWTTMRSIHPDPPINLLRAMLLSACLSDMGEQAAAVVWLTAADRLPLARLGREKNPVRQALQVLAAASERQAIAVTGGFALKRLPDLKTPQAPGITATAPRKANRKKLLQRVAASVGSLVANLGYHHVDASGFSSQMSELLADELDAVAAAGVAREAELHQQLTEGQAEFARSMAKVLDTQRWLRDSLSAFTAHQATGNAQLNALWWAEALYSPSLKRSYRSLPASLAMLVMATDLAAQVMAPAAASVGFLLAEAVNKLADAAFETKAPILSILKTLRDDQKKTPSFKLAGVESPGQGRLGLRDLCVLAVSTKLDFDDALRRAGLGGDESMSLPDLAHAIFRQEQAYRLTATHR